MAYGGKRIFKNHWFLLKLTKMSDFHSNFSSFRKILTSSLNTWLSFCLILFLNKMFLGPSLLFLI